MILEEHGSVRTTIRAEGWYQNETDGTRLGKYVTRITAYAGLTHLNISHRSIITHDTGTTPLRDIAWEFVPQQPDGNVEFGRSTTAYAAVPTPSPGDSIRQIQFQGHSWKISSNSTPVIDGGTQAPGWFATKSTTPFRPIRSTVTLREMPQLFPKELELNNDSSSPSVTLSSSTFSPRMVVHLWPKHGQTSFNPTTETTSANLYKIRYAHQGETLNLRVPDNYLTALRPHYECAAAPAPCADADGQFVGASNATGIGTAVHADMSIHFQPAGDDAANAISHSALFTTNPHAMADPNWNTRSLALGKIGPADPHHFSSAERALKLTYPGYKRAVVEQGDEYGMWIYGGTHNHYDTTTGEAPLHRVWQLGHYQHVWTPWLMYFRSGDHGILEWARANSNNYLDLGVKNFSSSSTGSNLGHMYHGKGFVPWGGASSPIEHFINPSAFLVRHLITGDGRSLDMYQAWGAAVARENLTDYRAWDSDSGDFCLNPAIGPTSFRELLTPLGELVDHYEFTWNGNTLLAIGKLASLFNRALECTLLPSWHPQWAQRYYGMTHDKRIIQRLHAYAESAGPETPIELAAFIYQSTGDTRPLRKALPYVYDASVRVFDKIGDRYHGWGRHESAFLLPELQGLAYYIKALSDAHIEWEPSSRPVSYPSHSDNFTVPPTRDPERGWSSSGVIALVKAPDSSTIDITLNPLLGLGGLDYGWAYVLEPSPLPTVTTTYGAVPYIRSIDFNNPSDTHVYPKRLSVPTHSTAGVYRIEARSASVRFTAPYSAWHPEAAVVRRSFYSNGMQVPDQYFGLDRQMFYARATNPTNGASFAIRFCSSNSAGWRAWQTSYFRVSTMQDETIGEGTLLSGSSRECMSVSISPSVHGNIWKIHTSAAFETRMALAGLVTDKPNELLVSVDSSHVTQVLDALPYVP